MPIQDFFDEFYHKTIDKYPFLINKKDCRPEDGIKVPNHYDYFIYIDDTLSEWKKSNPAAILDYNLDCLRIAPRQYIFSIGVQYFCEESGKPRLDVFTYLIQEVKR